MTDIIISFDTEDFTDCEAADAIVREADLLHSEGIRGCFNVVGLLAKQLKAWGRDDVVKALSNHEISYHAYGHTLHPTIDEYTDIPDFDAAYAEAYRQESLGVDYLRETFPITGVNATCPPGNTHSYAAMYAYADMGIPIYTGTYCDTMDGRGVWYCNMYHLYYTYAFESCCFTADDAKLREVVENFATKKRVVLYTHPNISLFSVFWDRLNYDKENLCEWGKWKKAPKRPDAEIAMFYANMRKLLQMIKADSRFRFTTYQEIADTIHAMPERVLTIADAPMIREQIRKKLYPIDTPISACLSDLLLYAKAMLNGEKSYTCGNVYGFLDTPVGVDTAVTLPAGDFYESAAKLNTSRFLPTQFTVGGCKIGPADWLCGALDVLCGEKTVNVFPKEQMPSLAILPLLENMDLRGTWLHSDSFHDDYLSKRLRLQSWTMRF